MVEGTAKALMGSVVSFLSSHIYLTLFVLVSIHFCIIRLLKSQPQHSRSLSPEPLSIRELYIYPIKSLRGTRVSEAIATKNGFQYDRTFMLLKVTPEGYKNMAVAHYYEMTQFQTSITLPKDDAKGKGYITVQHLSSEGAKDDSIDIALVPSTENLEPLEVTMHRSATKAFKMPDSYNTWFSSRLGYEVVLAYLGDNLRDVLFEDLKPAKASSWLSLGSSDPDAYKVTFADCAPYLLVSKTSLDEVSARLPEGEEMDVTKFRPNIVVHGASDAWEEDFWGKVSINDAELFMAHNCVRCRSINVDYATAKAGEGESGEVLKKLQKDRRVDKGAKWSPVFGRYCYWSSRQGERVFSEGDAVFVTKLNDERTTWTWKELG